MKGKILKLFFGVLFVALIFLLGAMTGVKVPEYNYIVLTIIEVSRYLLILYGIHLVYINQMTIDTILLIYTYYSQILANFEVMGTINVSYRSFLVSIERLNRIELVTKE